ncbi:MAG: beta-ketoacyl-ACP synthase [Polyangiaceae bacterium]|nr:beta-ketoacyl-ACP synthase [Polyangiaceae bacterium]
MNRRVVVTGVGLVSPIGHSLPAVTEALLGSQHGIRTMPEWESIGSLNTRLGAPVVGAPLDYGRKIARTMGRVGVLALAATDSALADSGLPADSLASGRLGLAYGSTHGSSAELETFTRTLFANEGFRGIPATSYLKFMGHTCAANLAQHYGIRGRVQPTVAACASASMGIGYAFEAIRAGWQDAMLCGGAEEMHFVHAGIFDILFATSTKFNTRPDLSPRPFDSQRDGLVVGEGAGTLVLEEYEHARRRGAHIHAELMGYGTNCDGTHVTAPSAEGMAGVIRLALESAGMNASQLDYVNAHGTGTEAGDRAESLAAQSILGEKVAFSSTKGHTGHTLGACGAIEAIFSISAIQNAFVPETRNLVETDPLCAKLNYIKAAPRQQPVKVVMSNNFAFGGINTSLIFQRI